MPRRIAILGSTGSIGCSTLDVVRHLSPAIAVSVLTAHKQLDVLAKQVAEFSPACVVVTDPARSVADVRRAVGERVEVRLGADALTDVVRRADVDLVVAAIVGAAGLPAVAAAIDAGKDIALANKESLVIAGQLLVPLARRKGVKILPIDSEHSAVFQAMQCGKADAIKRVILTASGGPFRQTPAEQMRTATVEQALAHPTWRMGGKISIDSATLFNKSLEMIEAAWLFDLPAEKISVVVHPESIVHSLVEYVDGNVIAQLSPPDMRTPIQYALTYPHRQAGCGRTLDWTAAMSLRFEPPDTEKFPAIQLAYRVMRAGGNAGAVLNAANEVAVGTFIAGQLSFGGISRVVQDTLDRCGIPADGAAQSGCTAEPSLVDLMQADADARRTATAVMAELGNKVHS